MSRLIDLKDQRFGRLTVIERAPQNKKSGHSRWICRCDCGKKCIVGSYELRRGLTQSCGCKMREWQHMPHHTHNMSNTPLYSVWRGMRTRCNLSSSRVYKDYGGRGIRVCDEWEQSFEVFAKWALSSGYCEGLTIDRIDVNGNYSPDNCRWITQREQVWNQRRTRFLTYQGITMSLGQWAKTTGMALSLVSSRFNRGWPPERIFDEPVHVECRNGRKKKK